MCLACKYFITTNTINCFTFNVTPRGPSYKNDCIVHVLATSVSLCYLIPLISV